MGTWVDFNAVKAAVSIEMVLGRYGVDWLRKNPGGELRGRCPIHGGQSDSFHANINKNNFQCFVSSCGAKGNVLDFVAAKEKCSVRDAALKLQDWFGIAGNAGGERSGRQAPPATSETGSQLAPGKRAGKNLERNEPNAPLSFQLKGIDHSHPYLLQRGITTETAETFGGGLFSGKGSMAGRVVIPIHNQTGELVAYAGRAIDASEPRYKLPAGFRKSAELYNLHRAVVGEGRGLIVVEGFFDAMKVHQAGYPFVVALMGCSLSEEQEELLVKYADQVLLMLDGDEAGQRATDEIGNRLLRRRLWVKVATVPEGKQPDQLSGEQLKNLVLR